MKDRTNNLENLQFLVSREIDGENLSADERGQLDLALQRSNALRNEREQMSRVQGLLTAWAKDEASIDWESHRGLIQARISCDERAEKELAKVDALLGDWSQPSLDAEKSDIHVRVMTGIVTKRNAAKPYRWLVRVGLPLAAAAAIAIAIVTPFWKGSPHDLGRVVIVDIGPSYVASLAGNAVEERTTVVFDYSDDSEAADADQPAIGFIIVRSAPAASGVEESAPL